MTNKDFYAFCRDTRKTETDPQRREALTDLYNYMRECGVSKAGVASFVSSRVYQETQAGNTEMAEALNWVLGVFQGTVQVKAAAVPQGEGQQLTLFEMVWGPEVREKEMQLRELGERYQSRCEVYDRTEPRDPRGLAMINKHARQVRDETLLEGRRLGFSEEEVRQAIQAAAKRPPQEIIFPARTDMEDCPHESVTPCMNAEACPHPQGTGLQGTLTSPHSAEAE